MRSRLLIVPEIPCACHELLETDPELLGKAVDSDGTKGEFFHTGSVLFGKLGSGA